MPYPFCHAAAMYTIMPRSDSSETNGVWTLSFSRGEVTTRPAPCLCVPVKSSLIPLRRLSFSPII
ncbi:MAG: hypothetical protein LBQ89_04545 [Treponema sp.]|nr:hypothetical protein [Treponema sp.]